MSKFKFIASNFELQEVDLTNLRRMTIKELKRLNIELKGPVPMDECDEDTEVLFYESQEDMEGLTISLCDNPPYNLEHHIKMPHIYWLSNDLTEKCAKQLLEYLKQNMKKQQQIEIWSIWFGNKDQIYEVINKKRIALEDITEEDIMELNSNDGCSIEIRFEL